MRFNKRQKIKLTAAIVMTIYIVAVMPLMRVEDIGINRFALLALVWIATLFGIWFHRNKA